MPEQSARSLSDLLSLRSRELRLNALLSYAEIVKSTTMDSSICVCVVHNPVCHLMFAVTCCESYVYVVNVYNYSLCALSLLAVFIVVSSCRLSGGDIESSVSVPFYTHAHT